MSVLALALVTVVVVTRLRGPGEEVSAPSSTGTTTASPAVPASSTGSDDPIRMVGFGDSVMAGAGCDCDDFLTQAADRLESTTGRTVDAINNSANGETSAEVLTGLRTDDAYRAEIGRADVVVLIIGANDLGPVLDSWVDDDCDRGCYHPEVEAMGDRLSAILTLVDRAKQPSAPVFVLSYWNVFEDGDVGAADYDDGYLSWSDEVTRDANATICEAADLADATCVDLYKPFKGTDGTDDPTRLLADDGDHPNAAGTALIAAEVVAAIRRSGTLR